MADTEREAFEAWSKRFAPAHGVDRDEVGQYVAYPVHAGWSAWKARAVLASRSAEVDDEGLPPLPPEAARAMKGEVAFFVKWQGAGKDLRGSLLLFSAEQFRQGQRDAVESYKMAESFCDANCCWSGHHADCFRSEEVAAPSHTTNKDGA
jgi:hypothetical protein